MSENNINNFQTLIEQKRIVKKIIKKSMLALGVPDRKAVSDYRPVGILWEDLLAEIKSEVGGGGSTPIDINTWNMVDVAVVSPNGDDLTAVVGDGNLPYASIVLASEVSSKVIIIPGEYNESIQFVDKVTYYFMPGSILVGGKFKDIISAKFPAGKVCKVLGSLKITSGLGQLLEIRSDIDLHFEFDEIDSPNASSAFYAESTAKLRIYGNSISIGQNVASAGYALTFRDSTDVEVTLKEGLESSHILCFTRQGVEANYTGRFIFNASYAKTRADSPSGETYKGSMLHVTNGPGAYIEYNCDIINEATVYSGTYPGVVTIHDAPYDADRVKVVVNGNITSDVMPCLDLVYLASYFDFYMNGNITTNGIPLHLQLSATGLGSANLFFNNSTIKGAKNIWGGGKNIYFVDCILYNGNDDHIIGFNPGNPALSSAYFYNCIAEGILGGTNDFIDNASVLTVGCHNTKSNLPLGATVTDIFTGYTESAVFIVPKF